MILSEEAQCTRYTTPLHCSGNGMHQAVNERWRRLLPPVPDDPAEEEVVVESFGAAFRFRLCSHRQ